MAFTKKQIKKIEELGWAVEIEEYSNGKWYRISKFSNAGEDFSFSIEYKNTMEDLEDYVMWFDVNDHVREVEHMKGAPDLETLIEDAREIEEDLQELVKELREL